MNVVSRGIRNAFRNSIRTLSIVIILGLSIGLSLTMLIAHKAVNSKISSVKSSIGNTISVSPAGVQGFEGGGNPLTQSSVNKLSSLSHVTSVDEQISDRLRNGDTTNLTSAIDPGSLGQRFQRFNSGTFRSDSTFNQNSANTPPTTFTPPIDATGSNDTTKLNGTTLRLISGQQINGNTDKPVALVGKDVASKNNLHVGSTFTAYGTTITVAGIFDTGTTFSNNALIFSLPTLQRLSGQANNLTSATVNVDSVSNIDSVTAVVKSTLASAADVTSSKTTVANAIAPLDSVKTVSLFSLAGAVSAGAVIILLTMVMVVRERKREIGITKAIGGSNLRIMSEFVVESLTLTLLGAVVGLLIGVVGGQPVTKLLVNNSTNASTTTAPTMAGPGGFRVGTGLRPAGDGGFGRRLSTNSAVRSLSDIKTQIGWNILLEGFGAAVLIGVIGSMLAAGMIAKVRPSEVMRAE